MNNGLMPIAINDEIEKILVEEQGFEEDFFNWKQQWEFSSLIKLQSIHPR